MSELLEPSTNIVFNEDRDLLVAHSDERLGRVLHIFDRHWHGIRSATACLPGGKLGISHRSHLDGEELRHIEGLIFRYGFRAVCFQGYSESADALADTLYKDFGTDLPIHVVTHVTTSQFEHAFEIEMLRRIYEKVRRGIVVRAGSVKPNFHLFHDLTWPRCIINVPPNLSRLRIPVGRRHQGSVFIPVENTWRKNLYTQVIAAQDSEFVDSVLVVNWPSHLEQLMVLDKVRLVGFQTQRLLLSHMSMVQAVMNVTMAECQPMTQLEAIAVGTPTLTGPLRLPGFSDHPLGLLCEVTEIDDPGMLRRRLDTLLTEWQQDPHGLAEMIDDFARSRIAAGLSSYHDFLGLRG